MRETARQKELRELRRNTVKNKHTQPNKKKKFE